MFATAELQETLPFIHDPFGFPAKTDLRLNHDAAYGCARRAYLVTVKLRPFVRAVHVFTDEENAMNGRFNRLAAAAAVTLGIAMLAPAAFAQTQPATPQQAPSQGNPTANPSDTGPAPNDTELKHFADAAVQVQSIRQSLQPQLAAAATNDARTKLKATAEKQMETAVQSHQLSLERYVQIANLVQTDSTVRAKVQKLLPPQPQASTKS